LLFLSVFFVLHLLAAIWRPSDYARKDEFYTPQIPEGSSTYNADVTLAGLQPSHCFVRLNFSLLSETISNTSTVEFDIVFRVAQVSKFFVTRSQSLEFRKLTAQFPKGKNRSSSHRLLQVPVHKMDAFQGRLTIQTDFEKIRGFALSWEFFNPSAVRFVRVARLLSSVLIAYLLIVFLFYSKFESELWTQYFLVAVAVAGIFVSNPIGFVARFEWSLFVSSDLLPAVFLGVYRMFLLLELELLRARSITPNPQFVAYVAIFCCLHAFVDSITEHDRRGQIGKDTNLPLPTEIVRSIFVSVYLIVSLGYCAVTAIFSDRVNMRRAVFFAGSVLLAGLASFETQVWPIWQKLPARRYSLFPQMLMSAVHSSLVAMTLFMFHCGGDPQYRGISGKEVATDLDLEDSLSDTELPSDNSVH
jgi:hypothetical protein